MEGPSSFVQSHGVEVGSQRHGYCHSITPRATTMASRVLPTRLQVRSGTVDLGGEKKCGLNSAADVVWICSLRGTAGSCMHHVGLGGLVRGPDMTPLVLRREQIGDGNGLGSVTTGQEGVGRGIGGTRSRLVGRGIVSVGPTDVFGRTGWVGFTVASRPPRESLAGLGPHGQWDGMSGMGWWHSTPRSTASEEGGRWGVA